MGVTLSHAQVVVNLPRGFYLVHGVEVNARRAAGEFGEDLVDPTIELLSDPDEEVRALALVVASSFDDPRIIGEPTGRDTLAAVGLTAAVAAVSDPEATIAIFTADHLIQPVDVFQQKVDLGYRIAENVLN